MERTLRDKLIATVKSKQVVGLLRTPIKLNKELEKKPSFKGSSANKVDKRILGLATTHKALKNLHSYFDKNKKESTSFDNPNSEQATKTTPNPSRLFLSQSPEITPDENRGYLSQNAEYEAKRFISKKSYKEDIDRIKKKITKSSEENKEAESIPVPNKDPAFDFSMRIKQAFSPQPVSSKENLFSITRRSNKSIIEEVGESGTETDYKSLYEELLLLNSDLKKNSQKANEEAIEAKNSYKSKENKLKTELDFLKRNNSELLEKIRNLRKEKEITDENTIVIKKSVKLDKNYEVFDKDQLLAEIVELKISNSKNSENLIDLADELYEKNNE